MFQMNSSLTVVNLSYNGLGDNGAVALSRCLRTNVHLADLDITNNRISIVGAKSLASGLRSNGVLNILKVSCDVIYARCILCHYIVVINLIVHILSVDIIGRLKRQG